MGVSSEELQARARAQDAQQASNWALAQYANKEEWEAPEGGPKLVAALTEAGDTDLALSLLAEAAARLNSQWARIKLGYLLCLEGRYEQALEHYQAAHAAEPTQVPVCLNLAYIWRVLGDPERAESFCRHALKVGEPYLDIYHHLVEALIRQSRYREAGKILDQILAQVPDDLNGLLNRGLIEAYRGDFAAAERYYTSALVVDPRSATAYHRLAQIHRFQPGDPWVPAMEACAETAVAGSEQAEDLSFALAKAYEDLSDYERAYHHLELANRWAAARHNYDARGECAVSERAIEIFDEAWWMRTKALEEVSAAPVFVVGMPRSGTTLVERLLVNHARLPTGGELHCLPDVIRRIVGPVNANSLERLKAPTRADLVAMAQGYLACVQRAGVDALHFIDKMPGNYLWLAVILKVFPNARIVHCRRSARDIAMSCYSQSFRNGHLYIYDWPALVQRLEAYAQLMRHWRALLGERMLDIDYEQLTQSPEKERQKLANSFSRRTHPQSGARQDDWVTTASVWQARQSVYTSSIGRWRHFYPHMNDHDRAWLERLPDQGA